MNKVKKLLTTILAFCLIACFCIPAVACTDKNGGNFKKPTDYTPPNPDEDKYVIYVQSAGGMPLDGVRVTAYKDNAPVTNGQGISVEGKVEFDFAPDVYDLKVDASSLPEGYYVPDDASYKTSAANKKVVIALPSKVISSGVSSNAYKPGDVMHDFVFENSEGERLTLSALLEEYRAVVLNFWYIECDPCIQEFPAVQTAYEQYEDKLALLAISTRDNNSEIAKAKKTLGTTFHMGANMSNLASLFSVEVTPSTAFIDRYGVFVAFETGSKPSESHWLSRFNSITSDDYSQEIETGTPGEGDNNGDITVERVKVPDSLTTPSSAEIEKAIVTDSYTQGKITNFHAETDPDDAPYSWPFVLDSDMTGNFLTASNSKAGYSFAIIYCEVKLSLGDSLYIDYKTDTEPGKDILYTIINRKQNKEFSGNSKGWKTQRLYIANKDETISLAFCYNKDQELEVGEDIAQFKNLRLSSIEYVEEPTDIARDVAYGEIVGGQYTNYTEIIEPTGIGDDIYYKVRKDNGDTSLLMVDLLNTPSSWSNLHFGEETFKHPDAANAAPAALYWLSYWYMKKYTVPDDQTTLTFSYLDEQGRETYEYGETIIQAFYLQEFSDHDYTPVTKELKAAIDAFIRKFHSMNLVEEPNYTPYANEWLEMCYYYEHYGEHTEEHTEDTCYEKLDPNKGMAFYNAFTADLGSNNVNIVKAINGSNDGLIYKFTAQQAGVYTITSTNTVDNIIDPYGILFNENEEFIEEQDDSLDYDELFKDNYGNFRFYVYLDAGESCYLRCRMRMPGSIGKYTFNIERIGDTANILRVASTADGMGIVNEFGRYVYSAIDATPVKAGLNEYWYAVNENGEIGSPIYIDFVHCNYFDRGTATRKGRSLKQLIDANFFDNNVNTVLKRYYIDSILDKDENDPLYGLVHADSTLVRVLQGVVESHVEQYEKGWMMFACYYQPYGPNN